MAQNIPARLEERVQYASWQRAGPESGRYVVREFTISGDELPGWALVRARRITVPGTPLLLRTTWSRRPGTTDPLLVADLHRADSPAAARALALRVLGDFQSPLVTQRGDRVIGEIAFGDGSAGWIVFVRGNVVVSMRNGGSEVVPVLDAAAALDAALVRAAGADQPPG